MRLWLSVLSQKGNVIPILVNSEIGIVEAVCVLEVLQFNVVRLLYTNSFLLCHQLYLAFYYDGNALKPCGHCELQFQILPVAELHIVEVDGWWHAGVASCNDLDLCLLYHFHVHAPAIQIQARLHHDFGEALLNQLFLVVHIRAFKTIVLSFKCHRFKSG